MTPRAGVVWWTTVLLGLVVVMVLVARIAGPSDLHQNTDQSKTIAFTGDIVLNGRWSLPRDSLGQETLKPPLVNWVGAPFVAAFGFHEWTLKMPSILSGLAMSGLVGLMGAWLIRRVPSGRERPEHSARGSGAGQRGLEEVKNEEAGGMRVPPEPVQLGPDAVRRSTGGTPAPPEPEVLAVSAGGTPAPPEPEVLAVSAGGTPAPLMPVAFGLASAGVWISCPSAVKHVYFLRPDMMMTALLTGGWALATLALAEQRPRRRMLLLGGMWLAAGLAGLTKGPMALLIPAYAVLAALLIHRSGRRLLRLGWLWGVPIMLAPAALWLVSAYRVDPEHVRETLLHGELLERLQRGTTESDPFRVVRALVRVPGFYLERFAPWGVLLAIGLVQIRPRRWLTHPLAPAVVWVGLVTLVNVLFAGRSGSFVAPAYPAGAILAAYATVRLAHRAGRSAPAWVAGIALAVAVGVCAHQVFLSRGARTGLGERIKAFAHDAGQIVRDDPVAFVGTGHNPVVTLMGRYRAGEPTVQDIAAAKWIVMPPIENARAVLRTDELVRVKAQRAVERDRGGLGLYRREAAQPPLRHEPG